MELAVGGLAAGRITFGGTSGTLQIDGTSMPDSTIFGFVSGDQFVLAGVAYEPDLNANLLTGNLLRITGFNEHFDLHLDPSQNFSGDYFHVNPINPAYYAAGPSSARTPCLATAPEH